MKDAVRILRPSRCFEKVINYVGPQLLLYTGIYTGRSDGSASLFIAIHLEIKVIGSDIRKSKMHKSILYNSP